MKLLSLIMILLTSCGSSQNNDQQTGQSIPFTALLTESHSNIDETTRHVLNDSKDFEAIIKQINTTRIPGILAPEIDFSKFQVVYLAMGQRQSGGYSISVENIEKTETEVIVHFKEVTPEPNTMVTMAITSPLTMVRIERQTLPIIFKAVTD